MEHMHLWRIVWKDGKIQYLKGTCLADAVSRDGRYRLTYVESWEQVD